MKRTIIAAVIAIALALLQATDALAKGGVIWGS